jgi:2-dehydro-3-deoxygluconokinase
VTGTPDVIAVGETMFSLVALNGPLDEATSFHATHGGAESNTCVTLTRSGRSAAWVSRLGADPTGDRILAELAREGVQLSWVKRDPDRPTGLMLRDTVGTVRYYRTGSAASALSPDDLEEVPVEDARAVFGTGITPLLGRDPGRAVRALFRRARGMRVLDLNLRKGLWGSDRTVTLIEPLLPSCDIVLGGVGEFRAFEDAPTTVALARAFARRGPREVVVKGGRSGAGALDPAGRWHEVAPAPVRDVDPVGAGDAFDGGYLHARLNGADVPEALLEGARCGAAVAATIGDADGVPRAAPGQK